MKNKMIIKNSEENNNWHINKEPHISISLDEQAITKACLTKLNTRNDLSKILCLNDTLNQPNKTQINVENSTIEKNNINQETS